MSTPLQPSDEQATVITGCLMLLAIIALAFVFYITKAVLIPFVIAIFIVTIFTPLVDLLVLKWKMPHIVAITATLLLVLSIGFLVCLTLIYSTQQVIAKAETQYSEKLGIFIQSTFATINEVGTPDPKAEEELLESMATESAESKAPETIPATPVETKPAADDKPIEASKPDESWISKLGINLNVMQKQIMDYMKNAMKMIALY